MKTHLSILSLLLLSACSHIDSNSPKKYHPEYVNNIVINELKDASESVQQSLNELNRSNTIRYGNPEIPFANIEDHALLKKLSLTYYGPLENVLTQIGLAVNFKVQYFGKTPPFPIIVVIGQLNAPVEDSAINILRNLAVQTGKQASLKINTEAKVISVRYL
ncbi:DotD/TraH family lipoprotein [Cysteiniphilum sp. QT6929]|uniref:DotD/TraH family lipoprotein n=1 Tax=Cysteiniphilum sp. QT6929 TaxID=2975055 RepID=UPI0024B359A5|nr:DotD/TraH family lipoprotein [Cysteiniphilum sp. QT6929]WHN64871.1 DotD/TraH family lipoprotein [Cysteiniphilum sp. QT6929]